MFAAGSLEVVGTMEQARIEKVCWPALGRLPACLICLQEPTCMDLPRKGQHAPRNRSL